MYKNFYFLCLKFVKPIFRRTSLSLIKKMVHYIKPDWLEDICKPECPNNLAPLLVEVLATVLDNEVIFKLI